MWKAFLAALLLAMTPAARAGRGMQAFLLQALTAAREKHHVPAVAALVMRDGRVEAQAAVGVRALGHPDVVTLHDRWEIGSDTKAFTAAMIGRLVDQGVMSFDDTMASSFPSFARDMDPAYRAVTVRQLLSHTAGLPGLTAFAFPRLFFAILGRPDLRAQRAAVARRYLTMPPSTKPGEFAYSNLGYVVAAAIAEAKTGKPWEELVREQVFEPLGIRDAGFGPPGTPGKADQPHGHRPRLFGWLGLSSLDPGAFGSDNPPVLGPAATISITLHDWSLFAEDELEGARGLGKLLKPETYRVLQKPVRSGYALGWRVVMDPDGKPSLLAHLGSNGYWLADVRIRPKDGVVELVAMNAGNDDARRALEDIKKALRSMPSAGGR